MSCKRAQFLVKLRLIFWYFTDHFLKSVEINHALKVEVWLCENKSLDKF